MGCSRGMNNRMWKALLFVPMLASLVCAQGRGDRFPGGIGGQWWDNPVANGLNLSDAQNKQIHSIVAEYRSKLIDLRANEEKAQGDFQDVFNDAPADQRRANDAIDRLSNARGEMTRVISQMSLKMRNVLSAEQWQQLRDRQQERLRNRLAAPPWIQRENLARTAAEDSVVALVEGTPMCNLLHRLHRRARLHHLRRRVSR